MISKVPRRRPIWHPWFPRDLDVTKSNVNKPVPVSQPLLRNLVIIVKEKYLWAVRCQCGQREEFPGTSDPFSSYDSQVDRQIVHLNCPQKIVEIVFTFMDVTAHNQQISGLFDSRHLPIKLKYTIRQTIFFWNPRCWPLPKSASIGDLMPVHRNYPFSSGPDRKWIDTGLPMFLAHRKQLNQFSHLNTSTNRFWWHRWRRTNHRRWPNHCTRRLWLGITFLE